MHSSLCPSGGPSRNCASPCDNGTLSKTHGYRFSLVSHCSAVIAIVTGSAPSAIRGAERKHMHIASVMSAFLRSSVFITRA